MANRAEADAGGKPGRPPRKPRCPSEDVSLLERLRQGDHEALKTVADREWLPVYRRVRCIVGNRHAAEDAVQETFLRFWARREKWQPQRPIRAILLRIAANIANDLVRARRTRCDCLASWPRPASPEAPDEALERKELRKAVWSAIDGLPKRRRRALVLVHFEGCAYQEAADRMGVAPQTIANHVTAARKELGRTLKPWAE